MYFDQSDQDDQGDNKQRRWKWHLAFEVKGETHPPIPKRWFAFAMNKILCIITVIVIFIVIIMIILTHMIIIANIM